LPALTFPARSFPHPSPRLAAKLAEQLDEYDADYAPEEALDAAEKDKQKPAGEGKEAAGGGGGRRLLKSKLR